MTLGLQAYGFSSQQIENTYLIMNVRGDPTLSMITKYHDDESALLFLHRRSASLEFRALI